MKSLVLCLMFITALTANAQTDNTPNWSVTSEDYYKTGTMMVSDAAGNAITIGDRPSYLGDAYIFIRKFDVVGNLLWEQTDTVGIDWYWQKPRWVNTDDDNNIYVAGYRYTGTSDFYTSEIVALKYDPNGNLLWKTVVDHAWPGALPMRSCLDSENNFYIGTVGLSPGFTLIKFDTEGNVVFNVADASALNQSFTSMRLKDDLVVLTSYGGNGSILSVAAFNTNGDFLWSHSLESRGGMDVEIDDDLNVYLLSRKLNQVSFTSDFDVKIYKFNSDGLLLDEFNYDFGTTIDFSNRMTLVNNKISIIGQTIPLVGGYMDWLTFQIDLEGNLLWEAHYNGMLSNDEIAYWITANEEGDVFVSGKGGPAYIDFNGSQYLQFVTLKYHNGQMMWSDTNPYQGYTGIVSALDNNCGIYVLGETSMTVNHYTDDCISNSTDESISLKTDELTVFPNPAKDFTTLKFDMSQGEKMRIVIYNTMGELIQEMDTRSIHSGANQMTISLVGWSDGVYLVTVIGERFSRSAILNKQ